MPETSKTPRRGWRILLIIGVVLILALVVSMVIRAGRTTAAVTLGAIPYQDGETWQYSWTQAGQPVGSLTLAASSGNVNGKPVWVLQVDARLGADPTVKPVDTATVTADAVTLLPISTVVATDQADGHYAINVSYSAKKAGFTAETPRGPQSGAAQLPGATYDNDQVPMLIRALPLAEGYSTKLECLQTRNIVTYTAIVKVEGKEDLTIGGETIACWRVSLTVAGSTLKYWYATSPDHRLVRFDSPSGVFELQSTSENAIGPAGAQPIQ